MGQPGPVDLRKGPRHAFRAVQRNKRPYHLPWPRRTAEGVHPLGSVGGQYVFLITSRAKRGIFAIGRFNGGSLFLMACANLAVSIYSIDIAP